MSDTARLRFGDPSPDDLRRDGWKVAVHNDYQLGGYDYTFWLLTKRFPEDGITRAVKGEGRTDSDALDQARLEVAKVTRAATDCR